MRRSVFFLSFLPLFLISALNAQNYSISTIAGRTLITEGGPATTSFFRYPTAVAADSLGNFYVADQDANRVFKVDKLSKITTFAGVGLPASNGDGGPASAANINSPGALAVDSSNNVYILEEAGGRVRKVTTDGLISTVAGNGSGSNSGDGGPATNAGLTGLALAVDKAGNIYIGQAGAFLGLGSTVRMVNAATGIITTIAGTGQTGVSGDGGPATGAKFGAILGLAIDGSGLLYIADNYYGLIRKVDSKGVITTIAGTGTYGYSGDGGPATSAKLNPYGITVDPAATTLYLSDLDNAVVRKIDLVGGKITLAAGTPGRGAFGGDGTATALLDGPFGLVLDASRNLYIADSFNGRIRQLNGQGFFSTVAGTTVHDGSAASAFFNRPEGLYLDNKGDLFIADSGNFLIRQIVLAGGTISSLPSTNNPAYLPYVQAVAADASGNVYASAEQYWAIFKFSLTGQITQYAGSGTYGFLDGSPSTSKIGTVTSMTFDSAGSLYFVDSSNSRVRKVDSIGGISTVAGSGSRASSGDNGPALSAGMDPIDVAVDKKTTGAFYVADYSNHCIRRFTAGGTITTVVGIPGRKGYGGDGGPASKALLSNPTAVAADKDGSLFIADWGNSVIRKVTPDGNITTIAGTGNPLFNGDGAALGANIGPGRIAIDSAGTIYFTDLFNDRVRTLTAVNPAKLAINSGDMQSAPLGATLPISVKVTDASGSPYANAAITFAVKTGDATLTPATATTGVDGTAATSVKLGMTPGPVTVTASSTGLASVTFTLTATNAPVTAASIAASAGDKQSGVVGTTLPQNLTVLVTGSDGNPFAGATVTFAVASGAATLNPTAPQMTGMDGKASVGVKLGNTAGPITVTATVAGLSPVTFSITATPAPNTPQIFPGGVVSAGLTAPTIQVASPNAILSIFGNNFAPAGTSRKVAGSDLVNGLVPTNLLGVCAMFNDQRAPIFLVTPGQLNVQAPKLPATGNVNVQVITNCDTPNALTSVAISVPVAAAAPEFFYASVGADGKNPVAATDGVTGGGVGDPARLGQGFALAYPNEVVTIYATGFGLTSPAFAPGELPATGTKVTGLTVSIDGAPVDPSAISYAGVAPLNAGLYQLNLTLPSGLTPTDHTITVTVAGATSPLKAYISVGPVPGK